MSDWQPISRSVPRYYAVKRPSSLMSPDEPPRLEPLPVVTEVYERGYLNGVLFVRRVVDDKVVEQRPVK